jgi:hypothetical protein
LKRVVLPLVAEPAEPTKKEDLAQVDLLSDPANANSTKVKFSFKILDGAHDTPREIITWRRNVEKSFVGLHTNTGTTQHQMVQQFCRGTALSTYNHNVLTLFTTVRTNDIAAAQAAVDADDGTDAIALAALNQTLADRTAATQETYLAAAGDGAFVVTTALNEMMTSLLPTKALQRVKRHLRREARKPIDMNVKSYFMHLSRINNEEIPLLPPNYNNAQRLGNDEIVDILLFGTPKSWQKEMDRQGFDPIDGKTPLQVVAFMERIETSEDFDNDRKATKPAAKGKKGKDQSHTSPDKSSYYCMLHGNNNSHDTADCKSLKAQAKKMKGGGDSHKKNKNGNNKSWKNKAKDDGNDSRKELAALVKKANQLMKKDLNVIEPVKKRKVNWPEKEINHEIDLIDQELAKFNYGELDKIDIDTDDNTKKEDGEVDLPISDEVSV